MMHDDSWVEIDFTSSNNPRLCCRNFSAFDSQFASATTEKNEKLEIFNRCKLLLKYFQI